MKAQRALKLVTPTTDERVPLIYADLPSFEELAGPFREILESRKMSNFGKYNTAFETEAGKFLGCHTATVSSGTMGLLFSLQALGLKAGEQALLPSFTFMATAHAVLYAGATPVFCEITPNMTIDVADAERELKANKNITVVVAIHTYGLPAPVDELRAMVNAVNQSQKRNVKILYDAAHSFGSAKGDRRVGTFGDAEVFSLSATKALVSVEGGMITSLDESLIQRIRKMRNYGIESNYNTHYPGMNGKMSEFHAAVGLFNLKNLEQVLATRKTKAAYYTKAIESQTAFRTIPTPANVTHTYKDFTVFVPESGAGKRDAICRYLTEHGVENRAYFFPPVHEQEFFKRFKTRALPATETLSRRCITLPFFTTITEAQMNRVAFVLAEAEKANR